MLEETEAVELRRLTPGLTYTMAEENKKKSWMVFSFAVENWDFAFTI